MKKIVLIMILLVLSLSVTFAYIMTSFKTNELEIKLGTQDIGLATLTDLQPGYVLIPQTAIVTKTNETKTLEYHLIVNSADQKNYTISHDLPDNFIFTHNNTQTYFTTGVIYTLTIKLDTPLTVTTQTFYININLI